MYTNILDIDHTIILSYFYPCPVNLCPIYTLRVHFSIVLPQRFILCFFVSDYLKRKEVHVFPIQKLLRWVDEAPLGPHITCGYCSLTIVLL